MGKPSSRPLETTYVEVFFESDRRVNSGLEAPSALVNIVHIFWVDVLSGVRDGFDACAGRHVDYGFQVGRALSERVSEYEMQHRENERQGST